MASLGSMGGGVWYRPGDGDLVLWGSVGIVEESGISSMTVLLAYFGTGGFLDARSRSGRDAFGGASKGGVRDVDLVA
jgi:hypothetical protein